MNHTIAEILTFIEEHDVKFIRLAFCDVLGNSKNISIMPSQIARIFEEGILFDGSAIAGFSNVEDSDLLLVPDPSTFDILPWRPQSGSVIRFFCEVKTIDKKPFASDCRTLLKNKMEQLKQDGYAIMCGLECEFYLFQLDAQGKPTLIPHDDATYFDVAPNDKGENVRRDICLTLEEMGITPESSHHEQGPGQNEIDFQFRDALTSCDQFMTFKWAVKTIAELHELHASFLAKPLPDKSGNGLHINLSLALQNKNVFYHQQDILHHFIAGILAHIKEMTLFLNPVENSYLRFGEDKAPKYISWSHTNRNTLIRVPQVSEKYVRCEVRSADPMCNPYLANTLLIAAGMEGIQKQLPLMQEGVTRSNQTLETLPASLEEAIALAKNSTFIKNTLPVEIIDYYVKRTNTNQ